MIALQGDLGFHGETRVRVAVHFVVDDDGQRGRCAPCGVYFRELFAGANRKLDLGRFDRSDEG